MKRTFLLIAASAVSLVALSSTAMAAFWTITNETDKELVFDATYMLKGQEFEKRVTVPIGAQQQEVRARTLTRINLTERRSKIINTRLQECLDAETFNVTFRDDGGVTCDSDVPTRRSVVSPVPSQMENL